MALLMEVLLHSTRHLSLMRHEQVYLWGGGAGGAASASSASATDRDRMMTADTVIGSLRSSVRSSVELIDRGPFCSY